MGSVKSRLAKLEKRSGKGKKRLWFQDIDGKIYGNGQVLTPEEFVKQCDERDLLMIISMYEGKSPPAEEAASEPMAEPVEVIAPAPAPAPGPIPQAAPAAPATPTPEPEPAAPAPEAGPAPRTFAEVWARHSDSPAHRRWAKRHGCAQCAEEARQQGLIGNILPGQLLG